jgi:hypothetical protein
MTGDTIPDIHVLKVITSAMESHSDYSLRAPRTNYTAISNWATRPSAIQFQFRGLLNQTFDANGLGK